MLMSSAASTDGHRPPPPPLPSESPPPPTPATDAVLLSIPPCVWVCFFVCVCVSPRSSTFVASSAHVMCNRRRLRIFASQLFVSSFSRFFFLDCTIKSITPTLLSVKITFGGLWFFFFVRARVCVCVCVGVCVSLPIKVRFLFLVGRTSAIVPSFRRVSRAPDTESDTKLIKGLRQRQPHKPNRQ